MMTAYHGVPLPANNYNAFMAKLLCLCLQVEDQMKLLQNCWSELLILDFVFKQMSHNKLDQLRMVSSA